VSPARKIMRAAFFASIAFALAAIAAPAFAEPSASDMESARQLFKEANDLRDAGNDRDALTKYKAAHALGATPITGLELGRAHVRLHELVEARAVLLGVERISVKPNESARVTKARADSAALAQDLAARIPTLILDIRGIPEGAVASVKVDGFDVPAEALSAPRRVNPGQHVIEANLPDGPVAHSSVDLAESESKTVTLMVEPAAPAPAAPAPNPEPTPAAAQPAPIAARPTEPAPVAATPTAAPPPNSSERAQEHSSSALPYVLGGVAVVGLAAGTIFGLNAAAADKTMDEHCDRIQKRCDAEGIQAMNDGRSAATLSTIAFAVGIGAGAGAIVLFVAQPSSDSDHNHAALQSWRLQLSGRF
jgi:hypothetical protein